MFLLNSRLGLFSAATLVAPLLPKLRGHFAEFLNNGYPARLRILSSPTCVGLRYGHPAGSLAAFLASVDSAASILISVPITPTAYVARTSLRHTLDAWTGSSIGPLRLSFCVTASVLTSAWWYRNIYLLSIAYDFRPRLRSRLTLSGRTFLRKP